MRNKARIKRILSKIEQLWLKNPDYRFYQMLINYGLIPDGKQWNEDDDTLEKYLDEVLK